METYTIKGEFIHLNQLIKAMGWEANGAGANNAIDSGAVKVNGTVERRKRNKIMKGFKVAYNNQSVLID